MLLLNIISAWLWKYCCCERYNCCFDVNVNLYTSRGSEEGTQASAEERFQGQEEEEVGQTTISLVFMPLEVGQTTIEVFFSFYSIGGGTNNNWGFLFGFLFHWRWNKQQLRIFYSFYSIGGGTNNTSFCFYSIGGGIDHWGYLCHKQ